MADRSSDDWLPAGWTVSVRVRRNGKKDKHYFSPCGHKFYSKVEVMRYLKTLQSSSPQLKQKKDAITLGSAKDASADALPKGSPNIEEKGKGSPESEDKYYSAEETVDNCCGSAARSGSLNSKDKENAKCGYPKSREVKALGIKDFVQNVCGSSMEEAKSNLKKSKEDCSSPRSKEAKNNEESANQICGNATEKFSHQCKEENVILEEKKKDACDHVEQGHSPSSKGKEKTRPKQSASALVERGVAEGLPDGWIKEVKVTKKKNVIRRDPYYIDPLSGYIFRSMKDALRYIATGNIGWLAFKRKGKVDSDTELEDDKNSSPIETKRQKPDENGTISEDQMLNLMKQHNSDENLATIKGCSVQSAEVRYDRVVEPPDLGKAMLDTGYYFDEGVLVSDLSSSDLPKLRVSGKNEGRNNTNETDTTPAIEAGVLRDQHPLKNREEITIFADKVTVLRDELPSGNTEDTTASAEVAGVPGDEQPQHIMEKNSASADVTGCPQAQQPLEKAEVIAALADEAKILKNKHSSQKTEKTPGDRAAPWCTPKSRKRVIELPRRTSNRLAGFAADAGLEVTRTRAQRGVVRKLDEGETSGVKNVVTKGRRQLQPQTKHARRGSKSSEPMASVDPSEAALEEDAGKLERDQEREDKKGESALVIPQENIYFANYAEKLKAIDASPEKPLSPFELPSRDILLDPCIKFAIKTLTGMDFDTMKSTTKSSKASNSLRDAASQRVQAEHMETEKKADKKQAPSDKNIWKVENSEEKAGAEIPSSSCSNLPFGDSWQDPCIEFAIKTLTGAIPVENDLDIHNLMRQQMRSTQIQESSEVSVSNIRLDNFCRTDLLWQHSSGASSDIGNKAE